MTVTRYLFEEKKKKVCSVFISHQALARSQTGSGHRGEEQDAGSHVRQLTVNVGSKSWQVQCGSLCRVTAALFTASHVCRSLRPLLPLAARDSHVTGCHPLPAAGSKTPPGFTEPPTETLRRCSLHSIHSALIHA